MRIAVNYTDESFCFFFIKEVIMEEYFMGFVEVLIDFIVILIV